MKPSLITTPFVSILLLAISLFPVMGCSEPKDPIDNLISETLTRGALENINIQGNLKDENQLLDARIKVPYNIKRAQVKPTLLAAIKGLKKQHPRLSEIIILLQSGGEAPFDLGMVTPGRAVYENGKIKIEYWIPTPQQIQERIAWNKDKSPDTKLPVPRLPTQKEFKAAIKAEHLFHKTYNGLPDGLNNPSSEAMARVAQEMNTTPNMVKEYRNILFNYYKIGWGEEIIQ